MAINNFSNDLTEVNVNGRIITDWGAADPPFTISPVNPKATIIRGNGSNGVVLFAKNQVYELTFNMNPGSIDSAFLQGTFTGNTIITFGYTIVGTLEVAIGVQGVIINVGDTGRAGMTSITDDVYIAQMLVYEQTKGGN
jgi:hypothetical protein